MNRDEERAACNEAFRRWQAANLGVPFEPRVFGAGFDAGVEWARGAGHLPEDARVVRLREHLEALADGQWSSWNQYAQQGLEGHSTSATIDAMEAVKTAALYTALVGEAHPTRKETK